MDIFVISLKKSLDRRKKFDKLNKEYIEYEYFDAIDGNTIGKNTNIIKQNASNYSNGALGCALSHLRLWNKCIELNKPIVIMEDDVFVSKEFNKHIDNVIKMLPSSWHILQLSFNCDSILSYSNMNFEDSICFFTKNKFNDKDIESFQNSIIYPTVAKLKMAFGTGCYAITPEGAKVLKQMCFPLDNRSINIPLIGEIKAFTIDCMLNDIYKKINAYVCPIPFAMTKHLYVNYESTIN